MISSFSTTFSYLQHPSYGNEIEADCSGATARSLRKQLRQRLLQSKSLLCLAIHASSNNEAIVLGILLAVPQPPASEMVLSAKISNDIFSSVALSWIVLGK